MTLKRYLIIYIFVIVSSCLFCAPFIMNISDWEKKIKSLNCVESVEIKKHNPTDDEDENYHIKIFLTENRFLQIRYFNPYGEKRNPEDFYIERIGDIVPVTWGYECSSITATGNIYNLGFDRFRFDYLNSSMKKRYGLIDLIKNYDVFLEIINHFPHFLNEFPEEKIENVKNGDKPEFESWKNYSSPFVYSNYNKRRKIWKEKKLFKMTVEEFNAYVSSHDWKWIRWKWEYLEENPKIL